MANLNINEVLASKWMANTDLPEQGVEASYFVNLRGPAWRRLGMTTK